METAQADLKDARILLVDDTPANLDVLCELLEARGCRISMAPNGTVALRLALEVQPDLILLDVVMPDMDGYEVCRLLKESEATRDIPVLFITANSLTEGVMAGFQVGGHFLSVLSKDRFWAERGRSDQRKMGEIKVRFRHESLRINQIHSIQPG